MEVYGTVYESVESVVLTDGNVVTWVVLSTALANDDVTSYALLTAEDINAESLSCAITTVPDFVDASPKTAHEFL